MKKIMAILAMLAAGMAAFAQNKNAIAVPEPKGVNLSEDTKWITLFIQGLITSNFQQYSGLTVIDRQNADMVKAEQRLSESAEFDEKNTVELGKMTNARLTVTGNIMAKSGAYALTFNITDVQTGETKASASVPNCLRSALEDGTAANQISYDLMSGFGITLSNDARKNLTQKTGVMTAATSAQVSVAKGIAAEQSGSNIEALTYYIQARKRDNKLAEATSRMATMTQVISSGNFGTNLKNMIKLRDDWDKLLTEVAETIATYVPAFTVFYYSDVRAEPLTEKNYDDKTVTFSVRKPEKYMVVLENGNEAEDYAQLVRDVRQALLSIPESKNWGQKFTGFPLPQIKDVSGYNWPGIATYSSDTYYYTSKRYRPTGRYKFNIYLLDKNRNKIAQNSFAVDLQAPCVTTYSTYDPDYNFPMIGFTPLVDVVDTNYGRLGFSVPADIADNDTCYVTVELDSVELDSSIKYSKDNSVLKEGAFAHAQPYETMTAEQRAKLDMQRATLAIIDKSVTRITRDTLKHYPHLTYLYIPNSVKSIDSDSFMDCPFLRGVYYAGNYNNFDKKVILHGEVNIDSDSYYGNSYYSGRGKFKPVCDTPLKRFIAGLSETWGFIASTKESKPIVIK